MVGGEWMEEDDRGTIAQDFVIDFGVIAADTVHRRKGFLTDGRKVQISGAKAHILYRICGARLKPRLFRITYGFVAGVPLGAGSMRGSSGITIQAIGYESTPITVITDARSHTSRTRFTSR